MGKTGLRPAVLKLMAGPEFHEFLIRASNDRLLTEREDGVLDAGDGGPFVEYINRSTTYCEAEAMGGDVTEWDEWEQAIQYSAVRAPLELIAHVVEHDLPYTDILTANYVMANPKAAEAYGADTEFDDPNDVHEFKPSEFARVLLERRNENTYREPLADSDCESYIVDPGNLAIDYPHAGILNSPVFMLRYPTTATNRNRARSRWTYYHFLGLDVEKSASRTTDPAALADTNNPTLNNPACTVCHTILDPVAGAFQNYDEEGRYRSEWGGMDSLDGFYKDNPPGGDDFLIEARSQEERETVSTEGYLRSGYNTVGLMSVNDQVGGSQMGLDWLTVRNERGGLVGRYKLGNLRDSHCGGPEDGYYSLDPRCVLGVPVSVPSDGTYAVEVETWNWDDDRRFPGRLRIWAPGYVYREGDTWYRGMRPPGFDGELAPDADNSAQWLAKKIVADQRFAEAAVKFWWPALHGSDVAVPPAEADDADFDGMLLAANAQAEEVTRLARAFRRGIRGGDPYNLKDLLAEMVLSRWFRAERMPDDDPVRTVALLNAGAKRLLTPEELARKTLALTGVQWGRSWRQRWHDLGEPRNALSREYGTLYGGIDSDGITTRARDMTAVMAGVAKSHAVEVSCPVVLREFYLLPEEQRLLFGGVDKSMSPDFEFGKTFEVEAAWQSRKETLSVEGPLRAGEVTVALAFLNDFYDESDGDRNLRLDRLDVRDDTGRVVASQELERLRSAGDCNRPSGDHFALYCEGSLEVPVDIPRNGRYRIEVTAWADQAGDELPKLQVSVESDTERSAGAAAVRAKLVDLFDRLYGIRVTTGSSEVSRAYELFVDVWERKRTDGGNSLWDMECDWANDQYFLEGILDEYRVSYSDDDGWHHDWNWDRINEFFEDKDMSDPNGVARTWTVVLMAMLMDQRYLHL